MKLSKLLALALVLLISVGTLAGSTIAWFTDEVTSANNIIKSGTLDLEVYKDSVAEANKIDNDTVSVFELPALWEPGAVAKAKLILKNEGSLAFNYDMKVLNNGENMIVQDGHKLSEVLKIAFIEDASIENPDDRAAVIQAANAAGGTSFASFIKTGSLVPAEKADAAAGLVDSTSGLLVVYWEPGAEDNNWNVNNGKTVSDFNGAAASSLNINLGLNVVATQMMFEKDGFGTNDYDDVATPVHASNDAQLKDAVENSKDGTVISLEPGNYSLPTLSGKEGVTIEGTDGSVIGGDDVKTGFGGNFGKNTVIRNVSFTGYANGVRYSYAQGGTTTFENCTFASDGTYGFHIDQSNGATFIFNNCTFSGFNAFASDLKKVTFNNCTFLHNGNYGHTNIWSVGEFNNCTFGDKASVGTRGDNAHLFFNGVEESSYHEYIGSAESLFAFAKSVNEGSDSWNGQYVILADDIDLNNELWTPIGQTGATTFNGIFDGQNHTISKLNVDSSAQPGAHYSSGLFGWVESHTAGHGIIKNVKIDGATIKGNHNCGALVGYITQGTALVENCHVNNATITCNNVNSEANGDKAGALIGNATVATPVKDCSASNSTVSAGRDAGQVIGAGKEANVTGCSATNVIVTDNNTGTGANIRNEVIGRLL